MAITRISKKNLYETIVNELPQTEGFDYLQQLLLDDSSNRLAKCFAGTSEDDSILDSREKLKCEIVDKAWNEKTKIPNELVAEYIDKNFAIQAENLKTREVTQSDIDKAVKQLFSAFYKKLSMVVAHQKDAKLVEVSEENTPNKVEKNYKDMDDPVIFIDDNDGDGPRDTPPPTIFGEEIDDTGSGWVLTETIKRLHCQEETPGSGDDDIIFTGTYIYQVVGPLPFDIPAEEVDYSQNDSHFYNTSRYDPPHTQEIPLNEADNLSLYLSSHTLTETDRWTEIAGFVANFLKDAVQNPLSKLSSALSGLTAPIPGLGTGTAVGGALGDAVLDALSDGLLTKAGNRIHKRFFDLISSIGIKGAIVFNVWNTAALIRWVVVNGKKTPKWTVRHFASGSSTYNCLAEPVADNPKLGAGYLRPSRYANTPDVVLKPEHYDKKKYPKMTGAYWYESYLQVLEKPFSSSV